LGHGKQNLRRRKKERIGSKEDTIAIRAALTATTHDKEGVISEDFSLAQLLSRIFCSKVDAIFSRNPNPR
jgi:hypothetical protein